MFCYPVVQRNKFVFFIYTLIEKQITVLSSPILFIRHFQTGRHSKTCHSVTFLLCFLIFFRASLCKPASVQKKMKKKQYWFKALTGQRKYNSYKNLFCIPNNVFPLINIHLQCCTGKLFF